MAVKRLCRAGSALSERYAQPLSAARMRKPVSMPTDRIVAIAIFFGSVAPVTAAAQDTAPVQESCPGYAMSLGELETAFDSGRLPLAEEMTGPWVAIGFVDDSPNVDCAGVTRQGVYEWVMTADQLVMEIDMIGMPLQHRDMTLADDHWILPVDFGGDNLSNYRCRLAERATLICLLGRDTYLSGMEFKRAEVDNSKRASRQGRAN